MKRVRASDGGAEVRQGQKPCKIAVLECEGANHVVGVGHDQCVTARRESESRGLLMFQPRQSAQQLSTEALNGEKQ